MQKYISMTKAIYVRVVNHGLKCKSELDCFLKAVTSTWFSIYILEFLDLNGLDSGLEFWIFWTRHFCSGPI